MQKVNDCIYFFQDNQLKKGKLIALEEEFTPLGVIEFYILDLSGVECKVLKDFCFKNKTEVLDYCSKRYDIL